MKYYGNYYVFTVYPDDQLAVDKITNTGIEILYEGYPEDGDALDCGEVKARWALDGEYSHHLFVETEGAVEVEEETCGDVEFHTFRLINAV